MFVNKNKKMHDFLKIFLEIFARNENLPYLCTRFAQKRSNKEAFFEQIYIKQ